MDFDPFDLLYGRHVEDQIDLLKGLWMQHEVKEEYLSDLVRDVNGWMNETSESVSVRDERQLQIRRNFKEVNRGIYHLGISISYEPLYSY